MADFLPAFDFVMNHEDRNRSGVVTREPKGAVAKYGINSKAHPEVDVRSLTLADATKIYRDEYWAPHAFSAIADQDVANKLFDMTVNMGAHRAFTLFQRAINDCGGLVVCDGALGPITLAAANKLSPDILLMAMRAESVRFYQNRAVEDPSDAEYLKGWLARAKA